ncbi:MAG: Uma2 family endonuclease [Deltaproteobacteria bacterium]|nr:Uma2 family endonuclease [Deltaproteobacteria bacterium]
MPESRGPFRPDHVQDGDRYEISRGHPVYVAPAGSRHGREHLVGAVPLATDPAVREAGIDVGYALDDHTLRAPDISIGNVPDAPGWADGAPRLAVEYADRGTNEDDLQAKVAELLAAGTELVWIVRLRGPRRVDVHARAEAPRTVPGGAMLEAPGILSRPLPVDALFDHHRADEVALENLLARHGHASLDAVRAEAREQGRAEALIRAIEVLCAGFEIPLGEPRRAELAHADPQALEALLAHLARHRAWP